MVENDGNSRTDKIRTMTSRTVELLRIIAVALCYKVITFYEIRCYPCRAARVPRQLSSGDPKKLTFKNSSDRVGR